MRFLNSMWGRFGSRLEDITKLRISYDADGKPFWQVARNAFRCIFSLYPKEWMQSEVTRDSLLKHDFADLRSIEPWWKLILGNKGLLPLLWSMYPNHPSLLPSYHHHPHVELGSNWRKIGNTDKHWVSKPIFGREGQGVFVSHNYTRYADFIGTSDRN